MKNLSLMNWIAIATVVASIFVHYFMFREDTQGGFAETKISDVQTLAEVEKLTIRVEHLELNNTIQERNRQNLKNDINTAINKVDTKLDNIYNILIK